MRRLILSFILVSSFCFGATDAKIKKLSKEIKNLDKLVELYYERAELYFEKKSYEKALYDFKKVMIFEEDYKNVKHEIVRVYIELDKPDLALAFIAELLDSNLNAKQRRNYLLLQADVFVLQEEHTSGIKIYEAQHKSKIGLSSAEIIKLADAYYEAGQNRKSLSTLKDALREDHDNYMLAEKMVEICIEETSYTLAHVMIERMLKHNKKLNNTYFLQAKIYLAEGKIKEAINSNAKAGKNLNKVNKGLKAKILALDLKLAKGDKD